MHRLLFLVPALALSTVIACGDKDGGDDTAGGDGGVAGVDGDGDGYDSVESGGDDCDDDNAGINPGATEDCDLQDDDCDGEVDEGFDADGDGHYDQAECSTGREDGDDCDDGDAAVHPGADEVAYDGTDQDCDGSDLTDVDGDGVDAEVVGGTDCDDTDATVYPGADEVAYDDIDQDCNGSDLRDGDGDGYEALEAGGLDCDDADAAINPDAEDIAYDGIDQDCDGSDNNDLDGDGYAADVAGGDDCDDEDPAVNPGAEEVPYDGDDQDCDGADLTDVDGDGYDGEAAFRGDDCDDEDPTVHPDAVDLGGDDVDADCDGADGGQLALDDLAYSVYGETGSQDYLGLGLEVCDADDDGFDDVIIAAPLANSYRGRIGVFLGSSAGGWSRGMEMADADARIDGEDSYFFGFGLGCADLDGDGYVDLVTTRAEINYTTTYTTGFEVLVWYGDGSGFSGDLADGDADAVFTFDLGVESGGSTLYSRDFTVGDVDGDGAAEILLNMEEGANGDGSPQNGDDAVWIVPGGAYSGSFELEEVVGAKVLYDQDDIVYDVQVLDDVSGDRLPDLFFGQPGYDAEYDEGDTGDPDYEGLGAFVSDPSGTTSTAAELAHGSILGGADMELGYAGAFLDIDGDGAIDGVLSSIVDETGAIDGGAIYVYEDLATLLADGTELDGEALASGHIYGTDRSGYFGHSLWPVGDLDGDGFSEVLAGRAAYTTPGTFVLLNGASLFEEASARDTAMLTLVGATTTDSAGYVAATGDIDGDGRPDLALSAYSYITSSAYYTGRAYMMLSSDIFGD